METGADHRGVVSVQLVGGGRDGVDSVGSASTWGTKSVVERRGTVSRVDPLRVWCRGPLGGWRLF